MSLRAVTAGLALSCALILATPSTRAAWSIDPQSPLVVDVRSTTVTEAASVTDGQGGMFIVYAQTANTSDLGADLWLQRIDGDGNVVLERETQLRATSSTARVANVVAIADGQGGAFIVFDYDVDGSDTIYAQHVDANGRATWFTGGVSLATVATANSISEACLALDSAGGLYVAWTDSRNEAVTALDIYGQHLNAYGERMWASGGLPICTAAGLQLHPSLLADGIGGAYVAWTDVRDFDQGDIFGQHLGSAGGTYWANDGKGLVTLAAHESAPNLVADGTTTGFLVTYTAYENSLQTARTARVTSVGNATWNIPVTAVASAYQFEIDAVSDSFGGAIVSWVSTDPTDLLDRLHLQRITASGSRLWGAAGSEACPARPAWWMRNVCADGAGGAFIALGAYDGATIDVSGQHIGPDGARGWGDDAVALCLGRGEDLPVGCLSDGRGGLMAVFLSDADGDGIKDVGAGRIDRNGLLLDASPLLTGVADQGPDQGGLVRADWNASVLDVDPAADVAWYTVWRRALDGAKAAPADPARIAAAAGLETEAAAALLTAGWSYVAQVPAAQRGIYSCSVPTYGDSTATGTHAIEVQVLAHADATTWWESNILSAWSVDDLAPGAPVALGGTWSGAAVDLAWLPSGDHDEDLSVYRIYRGDTGGFPLDAVHLVGTSPTDAFVDGTATGTAYYRVTAVDVHGNEGTPSVEIAVAADMASVGSLPAAFAHRGCVPNPFNPTTAITFDLPASAPVRVTVFDAAGRQVAVLVDAVMPAGRQAVRWDGRDASGRSVASGVYFARVEAGAASATRPMTLLR